MINSEDNACLYVMLCYNGVTFWSKSTAILDLIRTISLFANYNFQVYLLCRVPKIIQFYP